MRLQHVASNITWIFSIFVLMLCDTNVVNAQQRVIHRYIIRSAAEAANAVPGYTANQSGAQPAQSPSYSGYQLQSSYDNWRMSQDAAMQQAQTHRLLADQEHQRTAEFNQSNAIQYRQMTDWSQTLWQREMQIMAANAAMLQGVRQTSPGMAGVRENTGGGRRGLFRRR